MRIPVHENGVYLSVIYLMRWLFLSTLCLAIQRDVLDEGVMLENVWYQLFTHRIDETVKFHEANKDSNAYEIDVSLHSVYRNKYAFLLNSLCKVVKYPTD